ncbi:DUF4123 domain-containing protein [Paludisphaera mucosa]|uniref:DUF4123 domain-containing protein n=1 Tax=Paludisphaera mucosa TaxID=3030827 RepID=A0ABT6FE84_9BACT|nr:DUF4123 domain-containing protein [Paludisphaera mucosa]MDG3005794.1 DUF4123 domain-containing protein [Paludisphaera mucosa]
MPLILVLSVESGPDAGRSFTIAPDVEAVVGRAAPATVVVGGDPTMSRRHFALAFDGREARIRDLDSAHGTLVDGSETVAGTVGDGARVQAGGTTLRIRLRTADTRRDEILTLMRAGGEPLFAVLDAARGGEVYRLILEAPEEKRSLFEEPRASDLAAFAPYLIEIPEGSPFLERFVGEGWGRSWGVLLTSDRPFDEVRESLKRLSTVVHDDGRRLLFRFFDPRVLRTHLPASDPADAGAFFRGVLSYLCERDDGGLDRYTPSAVGGWKVARLDGDA